MASSIEDGNREPQYANESSDEQGRQQLVRKGKLILYNRPANPILDESVVTVQRYNCFGTNLFPSKSSTDVQLAAGVTSVANGDGKTVVSANLATFFALDTQDDTVLIDLNFNNPQLHHVFGLHQTPGVLDSLRTDTITLSRTAIKGLWVLPLGELKSTTMGFDKVIELREVIGTLKQHFRFIVVDLPSVHDQSFPAMITSHLDGYVVVVAAGRTKKTDISNLVVTLNENKVIGFVMNRVSKGMVKP
jgi:Mrp family chromosome partitioning ATPase